MKIKRIASAVLVIILCVSVFCPPFRDDAGKVYAAEGDRYTLNISGSYEYSGPQEMMEYINNLREEQGADQLTLDKELTDAAMQRAAEIAYYFSHTRPDERAWNTISNRANGENIAVGNPSAEATYTQWYNSPGHYNNMVSADFKSIGIGHFYHNGEDFWVQLFSCYDTVDEESRTGTSPVKTSISIVEKGQSPLEINYGEETIDLYVDDTLQLTVGATNEKFSYAYCKFDGDSFDWISSNEDVATVSPEGLVTPVGLGKTVVTATVGGTSTSITINVSKDLTKAVVSGLDDVEFTGSAVIPPLKVTYDDENLQEGTDYQVTYTNNVNVGTARVTIKGINDYSGTVTKYFKILRKNLEESVETRLDNWNYTSYASGIECIEENLKLYHDGKQLMLDEDYYIYAAYEYPEEGIVTDLGIMFKGNYTGCLWMRCLDTAYARIPDQIYTGIVQEPEFDLYWDRPSYGYSGCKYTKDKDYTVEFSANQEVGTATVKIIPTFRNYGSTELEFRICNDISQAEVADIIDCEYTGGALTPDIKVTYENRELQKGTDYTVYYTDNIQAGTAAVEIKGIGDFTGSVFKNFEIHRYKWVTDKEATEIATGSMHKQCVACDKTKNENTVIKIKACTHSRTRVPGKPATCTEPGNTAYYVCSEYGVLYSNNAATNRITEEDTIIPATGHSYTAAVTAPTCTEEGYTTYTCECGDSYITDKVSAKGHTAGNVATCVTAQNCTVCGIELMAATGHAYGDWIVDKAAACDTAGSKYKECKCGDKKTETIAALGHDKVQHAAQAATCTDAGWEAYETCSRCDYTTYKKIAAVGHKYGEWIVDGAATCTKPGSRHKVCDCSDKVTEAIAATGHVWESAYTVDKTATTGRAGSKSKHCAACDAVKDGSAVKIAKIKKIIANTLVYNGKVRNQNVIVVNFNNKKLIKGKDFTVTYKNAKGTKAVTPKVVGTYKAVVKFKGDYSGTVTKTFKIDPKGTVITKLTKPGKKQIKVTWKKQTVQTTGYQIRYSTKQNMNNSKMVTVANVKTTTKTIKQLKAKKKYWVQIRTYKTVNGKKYCSGWSNKKSVITK